MAVFLDRTRLAIVGLSLILSLPGPASADLIYFKRGGRAYVETQRAGDLIQVKLAARTYEFSPDAILKLLPGHDPREEWKGRLTPAKTGTRAERFQAFWWALENGLTDEATAFLAESHRLDPDDPAMASLHRRAEAIRPELKDPEPFDHASVLNGTFKTTRSPHFLLFHQVEESEARERLDVLERVYATYFLTFEARGITLASPSHRLVSVLFPRQADYKEFLAREHARAFSTSQGYFHPTRNIVVAYEERDAADYRKSRAAIEARRLELARLKTVIDAMPRTATLKIEEAPGGSRTYPPIAARKKLDEFRRDADRLELLLELERSATDLGIAAHEAIHQLVTNTGLAPHHDDFPQWLHEGLAAQFEVVRGGRWAGVGRAHDRRLPDFRSIKPPPQLAQFLKTDGARRGYDRDYYAQAWALVDFLRKERPTQFVEYLDRLRSPTKPGETTTDRRFDAFSQAFGDDLTTLNDAWLRFMGTVTTPLEDGEREPGTTQPELRPSRN